MNPIYAATDRRIAREVAEADCRRCADGATTDDGLPLTLSRMFLCPTCGNKRCPKATDHDNACSGSNAPGQPGSVYP